jgi:hypothetical protein
MPDRYAPALLLEVFAFWFVLRWLLPAALLLLFGRLLILMMVVGTLGTLAQHHYVWAAFFAAAGWLSWSLLRRWRTSARVSRGHTRRLRARLSWRGVTPSTIATLCEQRIGTRVDAAAPATLSGLPSPGVVLALADDAVWVLGDDSSRTGPRVGRVMACWGRRGLVSHTQPSHRGQTLELSWPENGALVRGLIPVRPLGDVFAGHLLADEFARRA